MIKTIPGLSGLCALLTGLKAFVRRGFLAVFPGKPLPPAVSNRGKMWSVDLFGFSQTKWGWNYILEPESGKYFVHEAFPFCPYCEVPMQHNGNPFLEAFCSGCEAQHRHPYHQVLQSRFFVLVEISKRYPVAAASDAGRESTVPDLPPVLKPYWFVYRKVD